MLHVAIANIKTYARRYIAAILAVAIGTAFLGASLAVDTSTRATLKNSVGESYRNADLVAFRDWNNEAYGREDDKPLTPGVLQAIRDLPGVDGAYGASSAMTSVRTGGDVFNAWLLPVSAGNDLSGQVLAEGRAPVNENEAVIDAKYAEQAGLDLGDDVVLEDSAAAGVSQLRIVGLTSGSNDPFRSSMMQVGVAEATWRFLAGPDAEFDEVVLGVAGDQAAVADALRELLREESVRSAVVMTADEKVIADVAQLTGGTEQLTTVLLIFALVALVVTGLVVMNTFAVVIAQRTRELALLRTLGAKRGQVRSSVLTEALLIGVVASALGIAAAIGLMAGLVTLLRTLVPEMSYATLAVDWKIVVVPLLVGIVMTVLAAWVPARRAMRLAPLAALRPFEPAGVGNRAGRMRIILGVLLLLTGTAGLVGGALTKSLPIAFLGGLASFPGILLLASLFVPPSVYGIGRLLGGNRVAGRLAALNAVRNPGRTTATATALLIGVTLVSMIMVGGQSAKTTLNQGLSQEYPVDLMVQGAVPDAATTAGLRDIAGIAALAPYEVATATIRLDEEQQVETAVLVVDPAKLRTVLRDDAAVPADGELVLIGWSDHEDGTAELNGREVKIVESSASYLSDMITVDTAGQLGLETDPMAGGVMLRLDESVAGADLSGIVQQVAQVLQVDSAAISGGATEKAMFSQIIDVLLMIVSGLLAVAVLIALIGVANTLSLSVLERTRENALLRALGLKKRQLRAMLATEAVLIGGVAALLGLLLGTVYGMFGAYSTLAAIGPVSFDIPWWQLGLVISVSVIAALLASLAPSRRAARLSPVQGLATE